MKNFFTKTENNASLRSPYSGGTGKKLRATLALPLRYLCATLLLLTLGLGQEAKAIGFNQGNIFFDATGWGTTNYVYFAVGKDSYTSLYQLDTHVANTNLYRAWATNNGWWDGCTYFAVFSTSSSWGSGSWGYSNISGNASCYTGKYTSAYDINSGNIYVITAASSSNGAAMSIDYQAGITGLNSTQTVTAQVKTANAANYSNAANCYGTSISAATHYFNSAWDSADQDGAVALSNSTVTGNASAALSSTVSLSLSGAVTTGYQFDGWYYSDGTLISTSTSASYTVRGATTVYARFSEKKFNVTAAKTPSAGGTVTPGSATAMGQITGGAITATPATGYSFTSWAVTSGTGTIASTTTASTTYRPTSASTVTATFTPKTYTVTLDKNGGASGGSATATYNSSTLTSVTHAARASYDLTGYYDATSAGTKIINANGTLVAGTTYTDASGNWTYDDDVTLYAQWDYNPVTYSVTYGVGTSYSSLGSLAATNTSTSASITSGNSYESGTGITFTASPNTGYTVEGWYTDATCTSAIGAAGTSNPYAITLSGNTTVYVKFVEATWSVAFAAGTGGTVTTPNSTPQTVGQITGISIAATPGTGYTFASWSSSNGGSFTSGTSTNANTFKPTANTTVTASFNETMSSLSTSCSYDAGTPGYAAPTVSNSATTIGYGTTRTITAAAAGTGYTFAGWTITNGTRTDGGGATANPITVRSNGDGAAVSVVANYTEDLSTPWTLKGGTNLTGNNWATEYNLEKKTGHSTESVAYYTFSVSSTNSGIDGTADAWSFKLINSGTWYGLSASGSYWWLSNTAANQPLSTSGANIQICATVAGDYEVKVDYTTPASPTVTVTFPTTYTLTYGFGTIVGTNGTIASSPSTASGTQLISGTTVTLTAPNSKTGYTWKGWYDNAAGTGEAVNASQEYTVTMNSNKTLYACYNEDTYAVTINNGDHGTVSPTGSQQVGLEGVTITATPAAGYKFDHWTKTGEYVTLDSETDNPTTVTALGVGTVTAHYIQRYILRGSLKDDSGNAGMAGWAATDNSAYTSATIAGNVMTVTATLTKSKSDYKFKVYDLTSDAWRGQTGSSYIPNATSWTLNGGNDVYFRATAIGTYTFAVDFTNPAAPAITVTRPTGYPVTYGFGSVEGSNTAPTAQTAAGISFNSADSIQSGTSVTFTASAAKTGYTWHGWYTTNNTSGTKLSEGESLTYTTTVNAAKTVYAVYTEDLYTVTVNAGENGSITTGSPSVTAGIDTKPTITATADPGFRFSYWEVVTGTATITDDHSASTTVSASSNAIIRAVFGSNWVVGGESDKFGNWDMSRGYSFANFETVGGKELGYVNIDLPANTEYEIKVYDHNTSAWYGHTNSIQTVTYTSNNGTALQFNSGGGYQNLRIVTAGHGTYQFVWNQTDHKLTINYPTSYTITYGQKTYYGVDESNDATTTGGTFSVVDGDDNALVSGKYIVATDAAVFTAVPASNYSLAGWYSDATCETAYVNGEGGAVISTNTLALTPSANKTVYAKFAENMTTVNIAHNAHGNVELGGATITSLTAGARTTRSITAVPDEGYYFAGWTVAPAEGADYSVSGTGEANTTITVTGNGAGETTGQTLTANFIELDKIYFRNIFDDGVNEPTSWENVYVYFDAYWEEGDNKGAGAKTKPYMEMTQIGTSNVYEAYVPRAVTAAGYANVAFSNADFHDYNNFYGSKAAYRGDYNRILNMFVPFHTSSGTTNTTQYFSNGYWMQYDTKIGETAGYYLKKRTGTNTYSQLSQFEAVSNHATTIQDTLRIDNTVAANNRYRITSAGGLNYVAASQITSSNCIGIELVENNTADSYFEISPSTEGNYIIQINQEEDKMKLNVIYPISVGDHRLKHTYTSGSAKSTYSDVIKSHEEGKKLSMYFDNTTSHSPSLVLQKCTALNNGVPTWGSETAVALTGVKTDTMGVYVFDLAVAGDAGTISNAAPYTGEYYVKADSLPGGWTNFTQNVMLLNTNTFDKSKSLTYDRYLCHWYGNRNGTYNTNIKCVVANEYNNQLTDTLFGDVIIGGADRNHQTLPFPGNVRFSYNSTTNELKRTYINGASDWRDEFLLVSGSSKIKATNGTALLGNDTTLHDENNWTYQVDIKAAANSNIILSAKFNNQRQLLLGSTSFTDSVQIVGGSSNREYNMRLVYDFKTDYLIAGYLAGGTNVDESQAIYSDVLIIREQQGNAEQINFASGQKLTEVRTVYGVMQFNKSYLTDASISRYSRNTYWISFPFDVKLSEAVGFGSYGTQWIIQYYDGAGRASKGLWKETPTYWTHVSAAEREAGFIMKANVGYILSLSLNNTSASSNIWDNGVTQVSIYFPSKDPVETIDGVLPEAGDYVVPAHPVTFAGAERDNRSYKDANWNVIGVPSYANVSKNVNETTSINENNVPFLYSYDFGTNRMRATDVSTSITFGAMQAYLVQYAGTIDWTLTTIPLGMAARRNQTAEKDTYTLCLNLDKEDENMDKTYIRFTDDATEGLDMNKDLTKNFNSGIDNIYTICEDVELAAQILPLGDETVYIPVGVKAAANGTCTFSMPAGTDGLEVYLFDRETNKHINMLISTYEADLTKGDINDRFVLEIRRAQMPTGIFTTGNVDEDVTKYMYNGHLYIKKGQCIYNAEGKRITNVQ